MAKFDYVFLLILFIWGFIGATIFWGGSVLIYRIIKKLSKSQSNL